jgi:phosphohistidine swiveling domain-containing protein
MVTKTPVEFDAPGPGFWALDRSHWPGGTTPISQWLMTESFDAGFRRVFAESGVPAEGLEARFVNGFFYSRLRPLIGADKPPKKLPPLIVLKIVTRLHPKFRARTKRAVATLSERTSIDVARRWESEIRPRVRAANFEFQRVDVATVDDAELEHHITELLDHLRRHLELHFWLHGHDMGPIAQYLHTCIGWGLEPGKAIEALSGASPATGVPLGILVRLRAMIDASGTNPASLDDVRAISPEAASLLDGYLEEHGNVLATGYDITAFTLNELPGVVLDSIKSATEPATIDHAALAEALRDQLGSGDRSEFDALLADARAVMDMRDDNGPLVAEWPSGLLRRALLAAGVRLASRGELTEPEHALELTHDEARSLFSGGLPSATEIARRSEHRSELALLDPPDSLGDPEPEPPLTVMPKPLADAVAMVQTALKYMGMGGDTKADRMVGAGIGTTSYTGRARTAESADDAIKKLEPGDVLVVRATTPAFNAVLSIAGAVVTADGGLLSHAAVLARELGIPAVVGAPGALDIADGCLVEVDPMTGTVRVTGAPTPEGV